MPISEQAVLDRLRDVVDPRTKRGIVEAGHIQNIKIAGGNVGFDVACAGPQDPAAQALKEQCAQAVKSLPDVGHVSVNLTQHPRQAPGPEHRALPGIENVIAVASGKGGVGKSTTSVNLAVALSAMGKKVGILDADIYGPSVPTMLAVNEPPKQMPDQRLHPATCGDLKMVSMAFFMEPNRAAILRGPMVSGYVSQFLERVEWGELDYLIIDYPPGTGDIQLTLSQKAPLTGVVITTTPQEVSIADVVRAVSMFETTKVPILGVVESMSYFVCDQCEKKHYIFRGGGGKRVAESSGVPFLGEIPIDPRLAECCDAGKPFVSEYPDAPASAAYHALAESVDAQLAVLKEEQGQYLESFHLEWSR